MSIDKEGKMEGKLGSGANPQKKFSSQALFKVKERAICKDIPLRPCIAFTMQYFKVQRRCIIHGMVFDSQQKKLTFKSKDS